MSRTLGEALLLKIEECSRLAVPDANNAAFDASVSDNALASRQINAQPSYNYSSGSPDANSLFPSII